MELEITNILWEDLQDKKKELPKELRLNWKSNKWDYDQVSNWLSEYFKVKVGSLNIKELNSDRQKMNLNK